MAERKEKSRIEESHYNILKKVAEAHPNSGVSLEDLMVVYSMESDSGKDDDMNEEDALEHFYYNIAGSYVGDYTPIYIWEYQCE